MLGVWQFVKGDSISVQYIIIITDCPNKTKEIGVQRWESAPCCTLTEQFEGQYLLGLLNNR